MFIVFCACTRICTTEQSNVLDRQRHCNNRVYDYRLNNESAESDQNVARLHDRKVLNLRIVSGNAIHPIGCHLSGLDEFEILPAGIVIPSSAVMNARNPYARNLTWRT